MKKGDVLFEENDNKKSRTNFTCMINKASLLNMRFL